MKRWVINNIYSNLYFSLLYYVFISQLGWHLQLEKEEGVLKKLRVEQNAAPSPIVTGGGTG